VDVTASAFGVWFLGVREEECDLSAYLFHLDSFPLVVKSHEVEERTSSDQCSSTLKYRVRALLLQPKKGRRVTDVEMSCNGTGTARPSLPAAEE
jgi:hypothetical protein